MTRNEQILREKIFYFSQEKLDFDLAKKEWQIYAVQEGHADCLCSKKSIKKLCFLKNTFTNAKVIVGSSCVEKFISIPIEFYFRELQKIKENILWVPAQLVIDKAKELDIINEWEYNFYASMQKWRHHLSEKQQVVLKKLNTKLLEKFNSSSEL